MSLEMLNKIRALESRVDQLELERESSQKLIAELRENSSQLLGRMSDLDRVLRLEESIRQDARQILGRKREPIDPEQAQIPEVIREIRRGK